MVADIETDICIIGAGSGGLVVAAGAAQLGVRTVLIEADRMGGDCLNFGCVPSKSLLAAARAAHDVVAAARFGVHAAQPRIAWDEVRAHVRGVIAAIAPHDSEERFEGLGATVLRTHARFVGPDTLVAGDHRICARRFVIATGSEALVPPIPGLDAVRYETNRTIFDLDRCPTHLIVIGGGPIGCELAQAHRRLGASVTVIEQATILPKDDPEAVALVRQRLIAEGVRLIEQAKAIAVEKTASGVSVRIERAGAGERIDGSDLLVAVGRKPNVDGLGLEVAGVAFSAKGIAVDARLRTSNRRIYAIGDVTGGPMFTHMAGYHGGIVIRNVLFRLPARVDLRALPWTSFTDPELAQVGPTEIAARETGIAVRVLRWPYARNDRAQADRTTDGFVKLLADRRGRPVGATIVGAHAGELAHVWALAIAQRLKLSALAGLVAPYPTLGETGIRAAGGYFADRLFAPRTRWLVRTLMRLG
jgi:pyruvate/2-oxoglutarate dehydrogenase complex dihydrolipoamide dehydrogenase (E3) component